MVTVKQTNADLLNESRAAVKTLRAYFSDERSLPLDEYAALMDRAEILSGLLGSNIAESKQQQSEMSYLKGQLGNLLNSNSSPALYGGSSSALFGGTPHVYETVHTDMEVEFGLDFE